MDLIKVENYLPNTAKKIKHRSVVNMKLYVQTLAEGNGGRPESIEVPKPGIALLFVSGESARQTVVRDFKKLSNVVVTDVPALEFQQSKNIAMQAKADKARESFKKRTS